MITQEVFCKAVDRLMIILVPVSVAKNKLLE